VPSFTFVSTANAFVLRGAVPVFVDIRADTLTLDERLLEAAITPRTRAIVPVHYAGVGCNMRAIGEIAARHGLFVVEDAAQALGACFEDRALGSFGHLAAFSFHETKNVIAGEGGALVVNDPRFAERAEVLWEKGTNRSRFARGEVDRYTWVDIGSSFLPGELTAAFLFAQLEAASTITRMRRALWDAYYAAAGGLEAAGLIQRPVVPAAFSHNAHLFYVLLAPHLDRASVLSSLNARGINAVFHYVPLHSSPAGLRYGRAAGAMDVTDSIASRLIRLPFWTGMDPAAVPAVVEGLQEVLSAPVA
jgi:dTDP-4-amino-4,6-dideoxygalactose transaminase